MARLAPLLTVISLLLPVQVWAETFLLMAEEDGCAWCAQWHEEIGHIYPKTIEGKTAPLVKFDIHDGAPDGIAIDKRVSFTPTFILVENGQEVGRIEGYPGEDFFWGLLSIIFKEAGMTMDQTG